MKPNRFSGWVLHGVVKTPSNKTAIKNALSPILGLVFKKRWNF
ncbi:Hypothetical protein HPV225_0800 [Helicobacter pylori v225d]|nr:Hypothetical protein HPV225_0800 [Helicobacter pylori v225d]